MRKLVLLVLCAAMTAVPSTAWASTGSEVSAGGHGPTDVVTRHIVIEPGSSTGWHYHTGVVVAVVRSGTLTRQFADCSTRTSTAGQAVVERPGKVHIGRNLGSKPVELFVTYVIPDGDPLAVEAPDPGC